MNEGTWFRNILCVSVVAVVTTIGAVFVLNTVCCRGIWNLLPEKKSREAIEIAEGYADGRFERTVLDGIEKAINSSLGRISLQSEVAEYAITAVASAVSQDRVEEAAEAAAVSAGLARTHCRWKEGKDEERKWQTGVLRDIIPTPFCPITINPTLLAKNNSGARKIAQSIYDDRAFDRMPILADALEEAGCTDAVILNHCRQPGEHFLGCWIVDSILGKR
jgi:hypothetical protein